LGYLLQKLLLFLGFYFKKKKLFLLFWFCILFLLFSVFSFVLQKVEKNAQRHKQPY